MVAVGDVLPIQTIALHSKNNNCQRVYCVVYDVIMIIVSLFAVVFYTL